MVNGTPTQNTVNVMPPLRSGQGCHVIDVEGKKYIDFCSQTLNLNLGQCHPAVTAAVVEQAKRLTFASSRFGSDVSHRLLQRLLAVTPPSLSRCNIKVTSGTLANEGALKMARKRTGYKAFISVDNSHHGQSIKTMDVSGKHHDVVYVRHKRVGFLPTPDESTCVSEARDCLDEVYRRLDGKVAGLIVEPIMVDAGVVILGESYLRMLREFATEKGIALIFDEIQTGFGWCGVLFAMDLYNIVPDILTLGKGLGAGYPLAAILCSEE